MIYDGIKHPQHFVETCSAPNFLFGTERTKEITLIGFNIV